MGTEPRMKTPLFRRLIILSVALNALAAIGSFALVEKKGGVPWLNRQVSKTLYAMRGEPIRAGYPNTTLSVYGQLPVGPMDIIFLGDDALDYGQWHELLEDPRAKNRAMAGDDTHTMLQRLEPIVAGDPRHVVVSCGINNIRRRMPCAQTAREYARIVTLLASRSPDSDIWLLPVLPVNGRLYRRWIVPDVPYLHVPSRKEVEALNGVIRALAVHRPRVHFVDLDEVVDSAGELRQEYTLDGLHLNGEGFQRVALRLRRELRLDTGGPPKKG
jgi:lysophospholipase L1-like esterase